MTKSARIYAFIGGCLLASPLFALDFSQSKKIIAFGIGPAWYSSGQTQTLYLQSNFANTYAAKKSPQALVSGELFYCDSSFPWQRYHNNHPFCSYCKQNHEDLKFFDTLVNNTGYRDLNE